MTNIRKYIDLVENFWDQPQRPFGRKGVAAAPKVHYDPKKAAEIEACKQHPTADAYADHNNSYLPVYNTDPASIRARADAESEKLKAQWTHWKHEGYF